MGRLARWRTAYWRRLIRQYGEYGKECRRIRTVCLCNGTIMTVGGVLIALVIFSADPKPPAPQPSLLERIGYGLFALIIMSGSGLLSIYFGRWSRTDNT